MVVHKKEAGNLAEKRACAFLEKHGLKLITQNYRTKVGEIDLIMRDESDIVFVEVRSRAKNHYGTAIESIDVHKQRRILKTSLFFLRERNWLDKVNCRFDIIGINQDHLEWLKNAFTADTIPLADAF